ncbi:dihydrofolate reductase [Dyadobacter sandarakinus]|uniref:Dihydrofolate reductase n=1 Tax=Dyadobacter sandarakinus TaxID=2747268 RepID=A0ABX7I7N5_9BACT|nr:dihydrofolate reductase [Dyadobacter sandarakinus]QRR01905.1 dihydrofolate reductase [Dyadobacter sandarakinus]
MLISLIVAVSDNGVIGKDNQLLWRLPDDLKRFKQLTLGHPMIMGRKTFESIGKPLPGRTSIVVTRNTSVEIEGVMVVHSLEDALAEARKIEALEVFIIGGGELYTQAQYLADRLYVTEVHSAFEGDTCFAIEDPTTWTENKRVHHGTDERHIFPFDFVDYFRQE